MPAIFPQTMPIDFFLTKFWQEVSFGSAHLQCLKKVFFVMAFFLLWISVNIPAQMMLYVQVSFSTAGTSGEGRRLSIRLCAGLI